MYKTRKLITDSQNLSIHEGQLSYNYGFVPHTPISEQLPDEYQAWEEIATQLPNMIGQSHVETIFNQLPALDVSNLEDKYLSRASTILANFAHTYLLSQTIEDDKEKIEILPLSIIKPWAIICDRLGRPHLTSSIFDAFMCNWKLKNKNQPIETVTIDDLDLLLPMFGNNEERIFNLTPLVMELKFAPALDPIISAVESVKSAKNKELGEALNKIENTLCILIGEIDNIRLNYGSKNYVDPIVWAKTVARFGEPLQSSKTGVGGASFPLFQLMDVLIERKKYQSKLGEEFKQKGNQLPLRHQNFINSIEQQLKKFSLKSYIKKSGQAYLQYSYQAMLNAYAQIHAKHRLKIYAYNKLGFRAGRIETNGRHRATSTIATEPAIELQEKFIATKNERIKSSRCTYIPVIKHRQRSLSTNTYEIILEVTGMYFNPGDRLIVVPKNDPQKIARFMALLGDPKEDVTLNEFWKNTLKAKWGLKIDQLPAQEFFEYVNLGYADKKTRDKLKKFFNTEHDYDTVYEFFEVFQENYQSTSFLLTTFQDCFDSLEPRNYSVAPIFYGQSSDKQYVRLTVSRYIQQRKNGENHLGVASNYLINLNLNDVLHIQKVVVPEFQLPKNNSTPLLLFAAGTGIGPFIGFIEKIKSTNPSNIIWLFLSCRDHEHLYYENLIDQWVQNHTLRCVVIFSRTRQKKVFTANTALKDSMTSQPVCASSHIDELINDYSQEIINSAHAMGHIYVCGGIGFSQLVEQTLKTLLGDYLDTLITNYRYHVEVFSYQEAVPDERAYPLSEIAEHNQLQDCWIVIDKQVYNVTDFLKSHPGSDKVIRINAGMDATRDYFATGHSQNAQINALLNYYKIGRVRYPIGLHVETEQFFTQWVDFLYAVLEMRNTLENNLSFDTQNLQEYLCADVFSNTVSGSFQEVFNKIFADLYTYFIKKPCVFDFSKITKIYCNNPKDTLLLEMRELLDKINKLAREGVKEIEDKGNDFRHNELDDALINIQKTLNQFISLITKKYMNLYEILPRYSVFSPETNKPTFIGCPFHKKLL